MKTTRPGPGSTAAKAGIAERFGAAAPRGQATRGLPGAVVGGVLAIIGAALLRGVRLPSGNDGWTYW